MTTPLVEPDLDEWLAAIRAYHDTRARIETNRLCVENVQLREQELPGADLSEIDFRHCDFSGANLAGAKLRGSSWKDCTFGLTNFAGAEMQGAHFDTGCSFEGATLSNVSAARASFAAANFHNAKLDGADLEQVDFGNSRLSQSDLTGASLGNATYYVLDRALVRSTDFSAAAKDPWSILRRTYTGPRFVLNLLLLVTFVLTLVAKSFAYQVLILIEAGPAMAAGLDAYCAQYECETLRLSDVLLGIRDGAAFFVVSGLVYNALRFILTFGVSGLREQEERSGRSPAYDPPPMLAGGRRLLAWLRRFREFYRWMYVVHRWLMFPLWIVVMISFAGALYGLATETIRLPVAAR